MKSLARFAVFGLLSSLFVSSSALSQQPARVSIPRSQPDTMLYIQRQSGTCPSRALLWTSYRYYEGGGEHTVIADTATFAGPVSLVRSTNKFVEFSAPLKTNFANCVGKATSMEETINHYSFQFKDKKVIFRVQLPKDTPSNPSAITFKNVVSSRPAVRWQIAD